MTDETPSTPTSAALALIHQTTTSSKLMREQLALMTNLSVPLSEEAQRTFFMSTSTMLEAQEILIKSLVENNLRTMDEVEKLITKIEAL